MPKRVGNLMPRIASLPNLHEAFLRAAKGKAGKHAVRAFRASLDDNIREMSRQLLDGSFRFGQYHYFTVFDPKQRTICAASFPDRVAFHAMMRICHPVFDDYQTNDSYASRKGRGQYSALDRTHRLARRFTWYAKLDMQKYFDSISHAVLLSQLDRLFKDRTLMGYFRDLICGYEVEEGRGLPIGNLTSQYFANHYLAVADHYARERLRIPAQVRYMDDILFFDSDKNRMMGNIRNYCRYVGEELLLDVHPPVVGRTSAGIPFLGYVVHPGGLRLNGRSRKRLVHKMAALSLALQYGIVGERAYASRATCLFAFAGKADIGMLKRKMYHTAGLYPQGL